MAEVDLGKVRLTEEEIQEQFGEFKDMLGGVRFGQDGEGNWGYIPPDGADAVIPFSLGGGGVEGVDNLLTVQISSTTLTTKTIALEKKYKAIIAYGAAVHYGGYPNIELHLETDSIIQGFSLKGGTCYTQYLFRMDLNLDGLDAGDTYAVKARAYNGSLAATFNVRVWGVY